MENYFFSLTSIIEPWLSSYSVNWVIDVIFLLFGVGLFYLIHFYWSNSPSPPSINNSSIRKSSKPRKRRRRKSGALKACRDCLQELDGIWSLLSFLQSRLRKFPNKSSFHQLIGQDPFQVKKTVSARAHWPRPLHAKDVTPRVSPPPAPTLPAKGSQPLTIWPRPKSSSVSVHSYSSMNTTGPGPPKSYLPLKRLSHRPPALSLPPQALCDSEALDSSPTDPSALPPTVSRFDTRALPLSTVSQGLPLHTLWPPAPIRIISGLGQSSHPTSTPSFWRVTANALRLSHSDSQQKPLSQPPPGIMFWKIPTNRQIKSSNLPYTNSNFQKLLEILITKKSELNVWKKKKEDGSEGYLNSLKMLKPLDDKENAMTYQSLSNIKDESEQLLDPDKTPATKILQNHLQNKHKQLFWGLPILHSESLLAPVRISGSPLERPSVVFNQLSDTLPVKIQVEIPSQLSKSQTLPHCMAQSQLLRTSIPQFQVPRLAQVQTQSFPALPPSPPSPPQSTHIRESFTIQSKKQSSLASEVQNVECHLFKKHLEGGTTLPSELKNSQQTFTQVSPKLQDIQVPETHIAMAVHPKELTNPQLQVQKAKKSFNHMGQSSQDQQKMQQLSWPSIISLEKELSQGLGKNIGKILKDLYSKSASFPVEVLEANHEKSKEKLMRRSTRNPQKKHLENFLRTHVSRKVEQIKEGKIPVKFHHSRSDTNCALHLHGQLDSGKKVEKVIFSKELVPSISTPSQLSVLSSQTQKALEEHLTKLLVRHRWHLALKILKSINTLKFRKTQLSTFTRSAFLHPGNYEFESHSRKRLTSALVKQPLVHLGERTKTKMSVFTATNLSCYPPPPISPTYGKTPTWEEIPQAHKPLEASPCGQEERLPLQTFMSSFVGRFWHSGSMMGGNRSRDPSSAASPLDQDPSPQEPCQSGAVMQFNVVPHPAQVEEDRVTVEIKEVPAWEAHSDSKAMLETMNPNLWSLSQRNSKRPLPVAEPAVPDAEESCLDEWLRKLELQKLMGSQKQSSIPTKNILLQDCETGVLLQDCATDILLQESQSDVFRAADILASQGCLTSYPNLLSTSDMPVSPMQYDLTLSEGSNQGQQKLQNRWKSRSSSVSTHEGEGYGRSTPRKQEQRPAGVRASQFSEMNQSTLDKELEMPRSKSCHQLQKKETNAPESHLKKKMKSFLQWIFPSKDKTLEEPLHKTRPASASYQRQRPVRSRTSMGSEISEAEALMSAIGRILEEKVAIHQGCPAFEFSWCNEELPSLDGRHFSYGKVLSYKEPRRVINTSHGRHHISQGHTHSFKNRWNRERIFAPRNQEYQVRPSKYNHRVQGVIGPHSHCPRHCLLQSYACSGASDHSSPSFIHGTFIQGRTHATRRKTVFSHVSTSSTY